MGTEHPADDDCEFGTQLHVSGGTAPSHVVMINHVVADERGRAVTLRFVALLSGSVLQDELIVAESRFARMFPSIDGHAFFLIETPPEESEKMERLLERELSSFAFDAATTQARLADYLAVQNTYLSTFQSLGGFGLLLGYKVMENFNYPFLARNISDFWRRWHISLTSFCRDYVYMGTISVTRNAALAAIASMMVMALWHEFSVRYVVWGIYHGIGIMIWQQFQHIKTYLPQTDKKIAVYPWRVFATLLTLHYVLVGFILVRHDTLAGAVKFLGKIFLFWV